MLGPEPLHVRSTSGALDYKPVIRSLAAHFDALGTISMRHFASATQNWLQKLILSAGTPLLTSRRCQKLNLSAGAALLGRSTEWAGAGAGLQSGLGSALFKVSKVSKSTQPLV